MQAAAAVLQRRVEQRLPDAPALEPGSDDVRRQAPGRIPYEAGREPDQAGVVLGHPATAGVGAQEVHRAVHPQRGTAVAAPHRCRPGRAVHPQIQLVEALVAESLGRGDVPVGHRTDDQAGHWSNLERGQDGPHASSGGARQVRRHPHRGRGCRRDRRGLAAAGAGRRAGPRSHGRWRCRLRRRHARRAGRGAARRHGRGSVRHPDARGRPPRRRHGVRRDRAGVRHPADQGRGGRAGHHTGRGRAAARRDRHRRHHRGARPRGQRHQRRRSRPAGRPGRHGRWAARRRRRTTSVR